MSGSRRALALALLLVAGTLFVAALALADGRRIVLPPQSLLVPDADPRAGADAGAGADPRAGADTGALRVVQLSRGDPLHEAGLRNGDLVVGLDGRPLGGQTGLDRGLRAHRPGDVAVFRVLREDRFLDLPVTLRENLTPLRLVQVVLPIVVLLSLGLGVFLLRHRAPGMWIYLLASLVPSLYVARGATGLAADVPAASLVLLVYMLFALFNGALMLHFFLTFPRRGPVQRRLLPFLFFAYAVAALTAARFLLPAFVPSAQPWTGGPRGTAALLALYAGTEIVCLVVSMVSVVATWRAAPPGSREQRQAAILFAGLALALAFYAGLYELPRLLTGLPLISQQALGAMTLIVPGSVALAIVWHRMFDINVLSWNRVVYGAASAAVALLYIALCGAAGALLQRFAPAAGFASVAVVVALFAIAVHPLRARADRFVDRVFYRKRYDYRRALAEIAARLAGLLDRREAGLFLRLRIDALLGPSWLDIVVRRPGGEGLEHLDAPAAPGAAATPGVAGAVGAAGTVASTVSALAPDESAALLAALAGREAPFVPDPRRWPALPVPALVAPLRTGDAAVGAILLGPRRVDVPYRIEDRDFLGTAASIAAAVFERGSLAEERSLRERLALIGAAVAAVVHELKNPLAAIKSALAVLARRVAPDDRNRELAEIAAREIDRLQDTILNVLSYVKPPRADEVSLDLAETLRQLSVVVEPDFRAAGVEVRLELEPLPCVIAGDPVRVRQALLNLLLNAREAMPRGGRIGVRLRGWDGARGEARGAEIEIADTGPGFSAEGLARAGEPFWSTKRLGTGLGLANVRRIAAEHGGEVVCANGPAGGAVVTVRLPARLSALRQA